MGAAARPASAPPRPRVPSPPDDEKASPIERRQVAQASQPAQRPEARQRAAMVSHPPAWDPAPRPRTPGGPPLIFWNTLVRFEKSKIIPWIALRNTLGVALPLVVGAAIGRTAPGLIAAIGAMNVSYSDGHEPYPQRARRMMVAACCCALAVAAGGLLGREHLLLILLAGLFAFAAGMMVAVTQTAADIGVMALATLIVFAAQAMAPKIALQAALLALGGGLLQAALAVVS